MLFSIPFKIQWINESWCSLAALFHATYLRDIKVITYTSLKICIYDMLYTLIWWWRNLIMTSVSLWNDRMWLSSDYGGCGWDIAITTIPTSRYCFYHSRRFYTGFHNVCTNLHSHLQSTSFFPFLHPYQLQLILTLL